jgi:molybdopterin-synthase adenylyltransferase
MVLPERYSRQIVLKGIGEEGQEKLGHSRVIIIGMGALGTVIANNLCRAGVGFIRLVDRDYVDLSNLQRQVIFNEQDVAENLPKAVAALQYLQKVNSEITLEPVVSDVNAGNIEKLIEDVDLVLDGTDNLETRFLMNEACHKHHLPWIYGGALISYGMTMNIIPGETPCMRCIYANIPAPGSYPTCSSAGVLSMITGVIGCVQSAEALKVLTGSPAVRKNLMMIDVWNNTTQYIEIKKSPECPTCGQSRYEFLGTLKGSYTTSLCGRDSVQVIPAGKGEVDFKGLSEKLKDLGFVKYNRFILNFTIGKLEISLFKDGRAIIKNVKDESMAKSVYSEYIGL